MTKLQDKTGLDNCSKEFNFALAKKGCALMIPLVMEAAMLDTKKWDGPLGFLGLSLFVDFSEDDKLAAVVEELQKRLRA